MKRRSRTYVAIGVAAACGLGGGLAVANERRDARPADGRTASEQRDGAPAGRGAVKQYIGECPPFEVARQKAAADC